MTATENAPVEATPVGDVSERCDAIEEALWATGRELPIVDAPARERADAARNRRRILAAAERLFDELGVDQVSMDAIAAEANVGKGTLFRRFGDRAGLARALVDDRERRFQDEFIRGAPPLGPGAPAADRLVAFGIGMLEILEARGDLIAAAELRGRQGAGPYPAYRAHIAALLREADPAIDADFVADALLGALSARLFLHQRHERGMSLERLVEGWDDLVRRLLE
ncbi:MAG: TetR/AcrR family transcriptional regulator [Solirubrobacteraceae bacterium]